MHDGATPSGRYHTFLTSSFWDGLDGRTDLAVTPFPKLAAIIKKVGSMQAIQDFYKENTKPQYATFKIPQSP